MNKKLLSVVLSLVMVMSLLTGCGKDDSTFFKEVKEISQITKGEATVEIKATGKLEDTEDLDRVLDDNGKFSMALKMYVKAEAKDKMAVRFDVKAGKDTDYQKLTTFAVDGTKLYLETAPLLEFIKTINEETATSLESVLSQIGVTQSISLDYKQLAEASGQELPDTKTLDKDSLKEIQSVWTKIENNFKDLQGKDGDNYTLTVNGDNADKAVDMLINFVKNDLQDTLKTCTDLVTKVYGEDSKVASSYKELQDSVGSTSDMADKIKENKSDFVDTIKKSNANLVAKARVTGKAGSRSGIFNVSTGDMKIDNEDINVSLDMKIKEGKTSVDDMIPKNAADITTLLITAMNAQAKGNDLLDDSEDILDDELYNYSDDDAAEETTTENEIF
ncbi:hypothetical protein [Eubacterium sp.]|uniref:hypothetical protein n=1 Tax=Eubacterium sp. TaxID=142586 RepID=UPI003520F60B